MLYDNAQLARVYLHAWQVTGNEFFRTITEEILDYVVREMTYVGAGANDQQFRHTPKLPSNAKGVAGFYSTQDADSEGEEGKFFVWTPGEIREVPGSDADEFMAAYGVTRQGNFDGKNILEFVGDLDRRPGLTEARRKLFEAREQRLHPGRDEKELSPDLRGRLRDLLLGMHRDPEGQVILAQGHMTRFAHVENSDYNAIRAMSRMAEPVRL